MSPANQDHARDPPDSPGPDSGPGLHGEPCDVLVVGGGPAGTTAATLLARRGWKVVLLEKASHPRFHIGESLLPMNLPILDRLGVLDQVRAIGVHKPGADFPLQGATDTINVFHFARAIDPKFDHALQVKREDFDQILFRHAQANGVEARERVTVERVEFGDDRRPVRVHARHADGAALCFRPRYLIDASGRDTFLGSRLKLKRKNTRHQSAAIFSHFSGVARRDGADAGNITVERFDHGWMWLIPLPDDIMSIGAVCWPEYLKRRRGSNAARSHEAVSNAAGSDKATSDKATSNKATANEARSNGARSDAARNETLLMQTLRASPSVCNRMHAAKRVAPVHVTGNYSYTCTQMAGPGWVMVGDAYAFVDPVFSSGVYLAMNSAEHAVEVVDGTLRDPARESTFQLAMATRLKRGLKHFSWFIYRFNTPVMARLFANPRNHFQLESAVISMLAGDLFDNRRVLRRLRLFRLVYALTALQLAPKALLGWAQRHRQAGHAFEGDTLQRGNP